MQAFVTGSTGLLGHHIVRTLLDQGHRVRVLVRSPEKAERVLGGLDVERAVGDMTDVDAFADRLAGCDTVFHTAAYFREYYTPGDHWPLLEKINVAGTLALARAAHRHGVKRFIDTSSAGQVGLKPDGSAGDESTPPAPIAEKNLYFKSKRVVEERLRALAEETGLHVCHLLPGWMFGPADWAPTGSGQMVLDFLAGRLPAMLSGGSAVVDARDVALAAVRLAEVGRAGERYIVAGRFAELREIGELLGKVSGRSAPRFVMPHWLALGLAALTELGARLFGGAPMIPIEGVRTMAARLDASSEKAVRELGIGFRPLEETLRDEVAWFRQQGSAGADGSGRR